MGTPPLQQSPLAPLLVFSALHAPPVHHCKRTSSRCGLCPEYPPHTCSNLHCLRPLPQTCAASAQAPPHTIAASIPLGPNRSNLLVALSAKSAPPSRPLPKWRAQVAALCQHPLVAIRRLPLDRTHGSPTEVPQGLHGGDHLAALAIFELSGAAAPGGRRSGPGDCEPAENNILWRSLATLALDARITDLCRDIL